MRGQVWELLLLPRLVLGCLCVRPQEFPLLPAWESLAVPPPVQFDAAGVVEPLSEILASISRLLLEDLPGAVAPKAPDPVVPGKLSACGATPQGSTSPRAVSPCWDGDTRLLSSRWASRGQEGLGGSPVCPLLAGHARATSEVWTRWISSSSSHPRDEFLGGVTQRACPCPPQARCSPRGQR